MRLKRLFFFVHNYKQLIYNEDIKHLLTLLSDNSKDVYIFTPLVF